MLSYELPLAEIVIDFYDKLKSRTKGYASFEYELSDYRVSNLVKVDILVSGKPVDAFSFIALSKSPLLEDVFVLMGNCRIVS